MIKCKKHTVASTSKPLPIIFGLLKSNSHEAMSLLCIKFSTCSFLPISRKPVYKLISSTSILRDRLIKCKRLAAVKGNFKDLVLMIQIQLEVPVAHFQLNSFSCTIPIILLRVIMKRSNRACSYLYLKELIIT